MDAYAITDAIVVTPRKIRGSASLLVEGGRVAGFGLGAPHELRVGSGAFVYPALMDPERLAAMIARPQLGSEAGLFGAAAMAIRICSA